MKYKVVKEFGPVKLGDTLVEDENGLLSFSTTQCSMDDDNSVVSSISRAISIDPETAKRLCDGGFLSDCVECSDCDCGCASQRVDDALELIKVLQHDYDHNLKEVAKKFKKGEVPLCVKVEADTVYYNLDKVLQKIKDVLNGAEPVSKRSADV